MTGGRPNSGSATTREQTSHNGYTQAYDCHNENELNQRGAIGQHKILRYGHRHVTGEATQTCAAGPNRASVAQGQLR